MSESDRDKKDSKQRRSDIAKLNSGLQFSLSDMQGESHATAGTGLRYHRFSTDRFSDTDKASSYMESTGLNQETGASQSWGTQSTHQIYRSRRGSIGGFVENQDGSVDTWRLSSHATTRALKKRNRKKALTEYSQAKEELETPSQNSSNNTSPVNTVISDFGQVAYDSQSRSFSFEDATHASGVSGAGLHSSVSRQDKDSLYEYSSSSMQDRGLTPTPSSTFHSEPMALQGHDVVRGFMDLDALAETSDMVGIMESNPNQICSQCAPMISQRVGTNSYVSGNPGQPFGGQKTGLLSASGVVDDDGNQLGRSDVERSTPSSLLDGDENNAEVQAIYDYHGKPSKYSARRRGRSVTPKENNRYFGNGGGGDAFSSSSSSSSSSYSDRRSAHSAKTKEKEIDSDDDIFSDNNSNNSSSATRSGKQYLGGGASGGGSSSSSSSSSSGGSNNRFSSGMDVESTPSFFDADNLNGGGSDTFSGGGSSSSSSSSSSNNVSHKRRRHEMMTRSKSSKDSGSSPNQGSSSTSSSSKTTKPEGKKSQKRRRR